jgi:hypothetical protein
VVQEVLRAVKLSVALAEAVSTLNQRAGLSLPASSQTVQSRPKSIDRPLRGVSADSTSSAVE